MMKQVTIVTFEEMEMLNDELDRFINMATKGYYKDDVDPQVACKWLMDDLKELKERIRVGNLSY